MRAGSEIPPGWAKVPEDMVVDRSSVSLAICDRLQVSWISEVVHSPFRRSLALL